MYYYDDIQNEEKVKRILKNYDLISNPSQRPIAERLFDMLPQVILSILP